MSKIYKILIRPNNCCVEPDGMNYTILADILLNEQGKIIETKQTICIIYPLNGAILPPILGLLSNVYHGLDYEVHVTDFTFTGLFIWDYGAILASPIRIINI